MAPNDRPEGNGSIEQELCVAFDSGTINRRSLALAVLLAERFKRGIRGVVVEKTYLRAVAELPFTTEIVRSTGEERQLLSEALDEQSRRIRLQLEKMLGQSAALRRVRFRVEVAPGERAPLSMFLAEHHDVFLPAASQQRWHFPADHLESVKWVYDGSEQSLRALGLLHQLAEARQTRKVYLIATCAVPRSVIAGLSAAGARVFWVTVAGEKGLMGQLASAPAADLVIVPGSIVDSAVEQQLAEISRTAPAPILVIA